MSDIRFQISNFGCRTRTHAVFAVCASLTVLFFATPVHAQHADSRPPVVVQPGAPGKPTKILPSSTKATLPPVAPKDVEFMQGMIVHHGQAVEMSALIEARTDNNELRLLGARISKSQADEIAFMRRWLAARGEPLSPKTPEKPATHTHSSSNQMSGDHALMPGMLSAKQMAALRNARDRKFDQLFLAGMIQHHNGALVMVKDLFDTAGAGQDAELFNFATDVDSGQRAEIRVMESMLGASDR